MSANVSEFAQVVRQIDKFLWHHATVRQILYSMIEVVSLCILILAEGVKHASYKQSVGIGTYVSDLLSFNVFFCNEIVPLSVEFDGGCLKTVLSGHGAFQVNAAFSQTV
jgi:hypothetical protein